MRPAIDFIQRERDRKIVTIVYSFLHAFRTFRQIKNINQEGSLRFADLAKFVDDRGQSFLFTLKTACQDLFRRSSSSATKNEEIFDLTVGSIFHLAMKLREDLYQLEFYGPKYLEFGEKGDQKQGQEALILKFKEIFIPGHYQFPRRNGGNCRAHRGFPPPVHRPLERIPEKWASSPLYP